jgi:hypothetical protein
VKIRSIYTKERIKNMGWWNKIICTTEHFSM